MKYTEMLKLKEMLEEANIPFTFTDDFFNVKEKLEENPLLSSIYCEKYPAYQIRLGNLADVIEHCYSYGEENDQLEIMGAMTKEEREQDSVLGRLTAEEVFRRFKYCWEHQTSEYVDDDKKKTVDLNAWTSATIYVANRIVTNKVCVGCGSYVLKSDSEEDGYQCLKCDEPLQEHQTVEIPDCPVSAGEFGELVARAYDYMIAEKEREKNAI